MGSRNPEKELMKNLTAFETYLKLAESALNSAKSSAKKLLDMRSKLETTYLALTESFHFYKADVIAKECKTEEAFNAKVGEDPSFLHNDAWADEQMTKYVEKTESIEDKVKEIEKKEKESEEKPAVENLNYVETEIEAEKSSLLQSIDSFVNEVNIAEKIAFTTASAMEKFSEKLKERLSLLVQKARKVEDSVRQKVNDFYNMEAAKLDSALLQLCTKVEEAELDSPRAVDLSSSSKQSREQVYLEKSKPPKFRGDVVEYPEFKRKWLSIVSKANLPQESELDKLRDSLPADAKEQLYGVKTIAKAWEILDKRFGDARIISMKLKSQLKSIQCEGKSDPDKVISLAIKVRTLVTKLEALNMDGALQHDSEFLSAVYCALPAMEQRRWLEFTKSSNHWADMMQFLEKAYNHATEELSLLATYSADKKVKPVQNRTFATDVKTSDVENNEGGKKEVARKRAEEFCGKCPVCSELHTWVRKMGDKWPSDRLLSCKKFNDMTVSGRAKVVEKCKGCPRCTSWNHTRDKCKMPANSCNKDDSAGVRCHGDHSRLLCGSGVPYCAAARFRKGNKSRTTPNVAGEAFKDVDENAETVPFFQDIPVEGGDVHARVFWDDGSTRVLIREKFAEELGLMKREVLYSLEVVGSVQEMKGNIYLLNLVDMYGKPHKIWGYGIDRIMLSSVPDLSALESIFPHVPSAAFKAMEEKEVDILIGLNMNEIFPEGGTGVDKQAGIKVKRSIFGAGWCVGGVLDQVSNPANFTARSLISSQAALVRSARVNVVPEPPLSPDFWECDQMGVKPTPRCDESRKCQQVGMCSDSHAQHTIMEQAELDLTKANTKLINGATNSFSSRPPQPQFSRIAPNSFSYRPPNTLQKSADVCEDCI